MTTKEIKLKNGKSLFKASFNDYEIIFNSSDLMKKAVENFKKGLTAKSFKEETIVGTYINDFCHKITYYTELNY